jgi:hypothetical protein
MGHWLPPMSCFLFYAVLLYYTHTVDGMTRKLSLYYWFFPAIKSGSVQKKEELDYFTTQPGRKRCCKKAGASCLDFRDANAAIVRYDREHKHDKTKQIPIH